MTTSSYAPLVQEYGYPLYVYDESVIATQLAALRATFPAFNILYSLKTNPHPAICQFMAAQGVGIDAASSYEVRRALEAGFAPSQIYYSAPGKSREHLLDALGNCVITADSYTELTRLDALAGEAGLGAAPLPVGLRINPDCSLGPGEFPQVRGGMSMKFGVDEENLAQHRAVFDSLKHIRIAGIHVFLRSQVLSYAALVKVFEAVFTLAMQCRGMFGWDLSFLNFGGGLGITSSLNTQALDTAALGNEVTRLVELYAPSLPGCALLLESGRFLVGQAGTFVTRIEDIKTSRGITYVIAPGGLNGFLRPAVMSLLNGLTCQLQGPFEPFYSNKAAFQVCLPENGEGEMRQVTVCGNLCTGYDVMAKDVQLSDPKVGDVLTISNAGAYGATLSPAEFASFPKPVELYRDQSGAIKS